MKIKGVLNAAWSPQSNQVERLHKWLGAALRLLFDKYDLDVDEAAEVAIYIYRSTPCPSNLKGYFKNEQLSY